MAKETRSRIVTPYYGKKMKRGENKRCLLYHNRPEKERAEEN